MNNESEFTPGTEIDGDSHIILAIPRDTARLKVEATLFDKDGRLHVCEIVLGTEDIRKARQDFLDNVGDDDYDARYVLTDEGRRLLEQMKSGESIDWGNLFDGD